MSKVAQLEQTLLAISMNASGQIVLEVSPGVNPIMLLAAAIQQIENTRMEQASKRVVAAQAPLRGKTS